MSSKLFLLILTLQNHQHKNFYLVPEMLANKLKRGKHFFYIPLTRILFDLKDVPRIGSTILALKTFQIGTNGDIKKIKNQHDTKSGN